MEKERLKDKIVKLFSFVGLHLKNLVTNKTIYNRSSLVTFLLSALFLLISLFSRSLSVFLAVNTLFVLTSNLKNVDIEVKYKNILFYLYTVFPAFSYIYILNTKKSDDIFLWLFLAVFFLKIVSNVYEDVLDGIVNDEHKGFTRIGVIVMSVVIGIISSIFLKQKLILFIIVNVLLAVAVLIQKIIYEKIINGASYINNYNVIILSVYSNFVLVFPLIALLISLKVIA